MSHCTTCQCEGGWPKVGSEFWFINDCGKVCNGMWINEPVDEKLKEFLGIFTSEALAQQRLDQVKEFIKTLK